MSRFFPTKILVSASALALAACTTVPAADDSSMNVAAAANPQTKAEIGDFGFDEQGMDRSVAAGDNFYTFANGTWAANTPIPSDKSNYGMFTKLADLSQERVKGILEAEQGNPDSKIGMAFASFLDQGVIEGAGMAPIQPWLDMISSQISKAKLGGLYGEADRLGIKGPFAGYVGQDDRKPTEYILNMYQSGLGMPDRDYYLESSERITSVRDAYKAHLTKMLGFAGVPATEVAARADAILKLETQIAKAHWTREQSSDAAKTYNKLTVAELDKLTPGFAVTDYLEVVGAKNVSNVLVAQPTAFSGIAKAIADAPLQALKDQLIVRSLESYSDVLPKAVDEQAFAFYGTTLSGTPEQSVRWKRAVEFTEDVLGEEVGKEYAARYFPPEYKDKMNELVSNVLGAMGRRIDGLDWMQPETKARAKKKLANFTVKVGYPDRWRDYSGLTITGNAFENLKAAREFEHEYNLGKLGTPIRRWEWGMLPQTVNAYANFGMMEVVFPAAILQPPFFDPNADDAVNYGGIGAVIGHEISHHFDDQGAKFDENGALNDWWTPEDVAAFEKAGKALIAQYDAYEPLPGQHVKGEFTLGENIGDLAGLTIAYDAYRHSLDGKDAPVIDGFSGDQRFYLGWAQVWRRNYRTENLANRLLTDPHSPSEQRAWVVRNLDPWYAAFNPAQGQDMYLAPAERVRIW